MCAIFGISGNDEAAHLTYLGLHALQHRGQEGAGLVSTDGEKVYQHRRAGLVSEVFGNGVLQHLGGRHSIGHTRYSTAGGSSDANLQPMFMKCSLGWLGIAHNGNLVNAPELTRELEKKGAIFQSTSDTEVIIHLIAHSKANSIADGLVSALKQVKGAFSLLVLTKDELIAVRDPYGLRPLVMGDLKGHPVFASETSPFHLMGAKYVRQVNPGEMIIVPHNQSEKTRSQQVFEPAPLKRCVFEYIYLSRPDSLLYDQNVYEMRKALGRKLAAEHPVPGAEVVIPVPDSGVPAAIGFAEAAKIPFDMGIIRSHYIGRTFIQPIQSVRDFGVRLKLSPIAESIQGKSVVVIDDSLVRGTTSKKLVHHLKEAGAREVHMRISAPPTTHPCYYGVDTPTKEELIASKKSVREVGEFIGADSLGYLSLEGLLEVTESRAKPGFCHACFSGQYL